MGRASRKFRRTVRRQEGVLPAAEALLRRLPKMSEILVDVAEPFLDTLDLPEQLEEMEVALELSAAIWNAAHLPTEAERAKALATVILLSQPLPAEGERLFHAVYERCRSLYPGESRAISDVAAFLDERGEMSVQVMSRF